MYKARHEIDISPTGDNNQQAWIKHNAETERIYDIINGGAIGGDGVVVPGDLGDLRKSIESLSSSLSQMLLDIKTIKEDVLDVQADLSDESDKLAKESESLKAEADSLVERIKTIEQSATDNTAELQADAKSLADRAAVLEEAVTGIKKGQNQITVTINNNKENISQLSQSATKLESTIVANKKEQAETNEQVQTQMSDIKQTAESITSEIVTNLNKDPAQSPYTSISKIKQTSDSIVASVSSNKTAQDAKNASLESSISTVSQYANGVGTTVANIESSLNNTQGDNKYKAISQLQQTAKSISSTVTANKTSQDKVNSSQSAVNAAQSKTNTSIQQQISNITQTAGEIKSTVVNVESALNNTASTNKYAAISSLQQTASSLKSSITDNTNALEGKISSVQQTANSLKSSIETINTNLNDDVSATSKYKSISKLQQTASSLSSYISTYKKSQDTKNGVLENEISSIKQTASSNTSTIASVQTIANTAKTTADTASKNASTAVSTATTAVTKVSSLEQTVNGFKTTVQTAQTNADLYAQMTAKIAHAKLLNDDPTFKKGIWLKPYHNTGTGAIHLTSKAVQPQDPNTGGNIVWITKDAGTHAPGWGGFYVGGCCPGGYNKLYIMRFVAKIPKGFTLYVGTNYMGEGSVAKVIGDASGTGDWKEYIAYCQYGRKLASGQYFGDCGYIYWNKSGDNTPAYTEGFYLSSVELYLADNYQLVPDSVQSQITQTANSVTSIVGNLATLDKAKANYAAFTQLQDAINLKVQKGDVINQINVSPTTTTINGKYLHVTGQTVFDNGVITNGMLQAGAITADKLDANAITGKKITGSQISGGTITGTTIQNSNNSFRVDTNGNIVGARITGSTIDASVIRAAGYTLASMVRTNPTVWHRGYIPVPSGYNVNNAIIISAVIMDANEKYEPLNLTMLYSVPITGIGITRESADFNKWDAITSHVRNYVIVNSNGQIDAALSTKAEKWDACNACVRLQIWWFK